MTTSNRAPAVNAVNAAATRNQSVAVSTLFSVSDADGDAITQYEFWDGSAAANGGHFTVNGITQGANQSITVSGASLAQTRYVGGDVPGSETVWVRAYDGADWSAWKSWSMATQGSAPVVSAANRSVHVNQSVAASALFSVSDADSDTMVRYEFWDSGAGGSTGHFVIGTAAQASNQSIAVQAADLLQLTYVGGSAAGSETLWVRADDGTGFGAWVSWTMGTGNNAPMVSAANASVVKGQGIAASTLFSVSDAEADAVTQYEFWDSGSAAGSGHFTVNGTTRPANTSISVPAANLSQVNYVGGSAGGAETVWVRASDGTDWSDWKSWTVTTQNHLPVLSAADATLQRNESVAASTLFGVSDADGDTIAQYEFWDGSAAANGGHFTVNGITQGANRTIAVPGASLAQTRYIAGDASGAETVWVRVNDGEAWSAWASWNVTTQGSAPVASTANRSVHVGQSVAASTLFSVSDADNNAITQYEFWDGSAATTSGHFSINGTTQTANQAIPIAAANLAQLLYVSGSAVGAETVWVRADDGTGFGAWASWTMNTGNAAPVVNTSNGAMLKGQVIALSPLLSATDAENDPITQYELWDGGTVAGSGYLSVGGIVQQANRAIPVSAASLAQVNYVGGSSGVTETLWARAYDGIDWGEWKSLSMSTQDRVPVVTTTDGAQLWGQSASIYGFFSVSDADGDVMTKYEFWDGGGASSSGYFAIDGQRQGANVSIPVTAANLSHITYTAGTKAGPETLWVRANDGDAWGEWQSWAVTTQGNGPVVTPRSATILAGTDQTMAASLFFSASDPDGDTITGYQLWDEGGDAKSGHFNLNGAVQPASQAINVSAANLAQITYTGGSKPGIENVWVRASVGGRFGEWASVTVDTRIRFDEVPGTSGTDVLTTDTPGTAYLGLGGGDSLTVKPGNDALLMGGGGADFYSIGDANVNVFVYEHGNSASDSIYTGGFGAKSTSVAATIDSRHLFLADTAANVGIIVIDWQQPENRIEGWFTSDNPPSSGLPPLTYDQMAAAIAKANVPNITWEQIGYSSAYFNEMIDYYGQREAVILADRAPTVLSRSATANPGQSIAASDLFTASDPDGQAITQYGFTDINADSTSGYFVLNGVRQDANREIKVSAAELATLRFVAGSSAEMLNVRAYDGLLWSQPALPMVYVFPPLPWAMAPEEDIANAGTVRASPSVFRDLVGSADSANHDLDAGAPQNVTGLAGSAQLQLLSFGGGVLAYSPNAGDGNESIAPHLGAGSSFAGIAGIGGADGSNRLIALLA